MPAQINLSMMLIQPNAPEPAVIEGLKWMTKAAMQGNAEAQLALGFSLWQLLRDEDDMREGLKWLEAARKQGLPEAQELYNAVCVKRPAFCGVRAS